MKMIIETFVTIIFITLTVLLVSQLLGSQLEISEAKDFHTNVVKTIEDSNFEDDVIQSCMEQASELGYTLEVSVESLEESGYAKKGIVTLYYDVELSLLGIERSGKIEANAR